MTVTRIDLNGTKIIDVGSYGAIAGDDNNDTSAINRAISDASAKPNTVVYIPEGDYMIDDAILMKSNVHLHIEDGASLIRNFTGVLNRTMIETESLQQLSTEGARYETADDVLITGTGTLLTPDNRENGQTQYYGGGLTVRGNNWTIDGISVDGYYAKALQSNGAYVYVEEKNVLETDGVNAIGISIYGSKSEINNISITNPSYTFGTTGVRVLAGSNVFVGNAYIESTDDMIGAHPGSRQNAAFNGMTEAGVKNIEFANVRGITYAGGIFSSGDAQPSADHEAFDFDGGASSITLSNVSGTFYNTHSGIRLFSTKYFGIIYDIDIVDVSVTEGNPIDLPEVMKNPKASEGYLQGILVKNVFDIYIQNFSYYGTAKYSVVMRDNNEPLWVSQNRHIASAWLAEPDQRAAAVSVANTIYHKTLRTEGIGTDSAELLIGSRPNDIIVALGGNDVVWGEFGDDLLDGGTGADTLVGASGADILIGGAGVDSLVGGLGDDRISAGDDADFISGGIGDDLANGDAGADLVLGGTGLDTLSGATGNDTLAGGWGNDLMYGGDGDDLMYGGSTNTFEGGRGNDSLPPDDGSDSLAGGQDNNLLVGGLGNDTLYGGEQSDVLLGSDGNDMLYGGAGIDTLQSGTGDNQLFGGSGDDLLAGLSGRDLLFGGDGNDVLRSGDGNDQLDGGTGDDLIHSGDGDDRILGGEGFDSIYGSKGNDTIFGDAGADTLHGGLGKDILYGGEGNDLIIGGGGVDVLIGNTGNDTFKISVGDHNHSLNGGDGSDIALLSYKGSAIIDETSTADGRIILNFTDGGRAVFIGVEHAYDRTGLLLF